MHWRHSLQQGYRLYVRRMISPDASRHNHCADWRGRGAHNQGNDIQLHNGTHDNNGDLSCTYGYMHDSGSGTQVPGACSEEGNVPSTMVNAMACMHDRADVR